MVGVEGNHHQPGFDTASGVKIQHPTFLEQVFNREKQTLFYPNKPPSSVNSIKLILMRQNAQRAKNVDENQPSDKPKDTSRGSSLTQWHF